MLCDMCHEIIADNMRLREITRRLRLVNGMLRRQESTRLNAEAAMGELWGSGEFDCGPQDYEYIVMHCINELRAAKAAPTPKRTAE